MKKIIIACDSFKGSLTSEEAGRAAAEGVHSVMADAETVVVAIGDGGEGTTEALVSGLDGRFVECEASDPLGRRILARYGVSGDGLTAIMEMASASGLPLLKLDERNPLKTSTSGTGEMIADALGRGCRSFLIGIGGSATNDCGMGMLAALGARFYDKDGNVLTPSGENMTRTAKIDLGALDKRLAEAQFTVACDVDNPLYGTRGAAYVYGPQKGATPEMVAFLDEGMRRYAQALAAATGRDVAQMPGAGAAGGLGAAFKAVLDARLVPGIEMVLDTLRFDETIAGASLVITGEGRIDGQTLMGKAPAGVMQRARRQGIPTVAIGGAVTDAAQLVDAGFAAVLPVVGGPCDLATAMNTPTAKDNIARTCAQIINLINLTPLK